MALLPPSRTKASRNGRAGWLKHVYLDSIGSETSSA